MELFSVVSARETQYPGVLDLVIDAEIDGVRREYPFTLDPADVHGLAPLALQFIQSNPVTVDAYVGPQITGSAIDVERERRIALPLKVAVPSGSIFQINMDTESQRNIQGLSTVGIYLSGASPGQTTKFRDYDNAFHDLLPGDLVAMGLQVAQRIQAVYAKAWALKALNPIPEDYADDSRW